MKTQRTTSQTDAESQSEQSADPLGNQANGTGETAPQRASGISAKTQIDVGGRRLLSRLFTEEHEHYYVLGYN